MLATVILLASTVAATQQDQWTIGPKRSIMSRGNYSFLIHVIKWAIPGLFFFICIFLIQLIDKV